MSNTSETRVRHRNVVRAPLGKAKLRDRTRGDYSEQWTLNRELSPLNFKNTQYTCEGIT